MTVKCFMLDRTSLERVWLRRYVSGSKCSSRFGYHNATFLVGDVTAEHYEAMRSKPVDKADANWPSRCSCGYEFRDEDAWQLFAMTLLKRTETGELFTVEDAPPGAMWYEPRYINPEFEQFYDSNEFKALPPEVKNLGHLFVMLPGGHHWDVDGKAVNGGGSGWGRNGQPPVVTARPSILVNGAGGYHGFLTNGVLSSC